MAKVLNAKIDFLIINHKIIHNFQRRIMLGVIHFLMLEKTDEFNKELDDILQEILK